MNFYDFCKWMVGASPSPQTGATNQPLAVPFTDDNKNMENRNGKETASTLRKLRDAELCKLSEQEWNSNCKERYGMWWWLFNYRSPEQGGATAPVDDDEHVID